MNRLAPTFAVACTLALGGVRLSATGEISLTHDDNVFRLSPSDLDAFRLSQRPYRFPFRSADDVDVLLGSLVGARLTSSTLLEFRGRFHVFTSNWEKSYGAAALGVEQSLPWVGRLAGDYTVMPDYLIRHYREPGSTDTARYVACRYSQNLVGVQLSREFGPATLRPGYGFQLDNYLRAFDYYDTRAHRLTGELGYEAARNLSLQVRYEFRNATATGPVPDISHNQHAIRVRVATRPQRLDRFGIEAGYEFIRRVYTTTNQATVDPGHAGRVDNTSNVHLNFSYRLTGVALRAGYEFEWRDVSSPYESEIEDIKEYRAGRFTLGASMNPGRAK